MVLSILDPTPVLMEVILRKIREERFETTTTDSESEVRVGLDTEVDTVVDSDNEPTPNLCHIEVEIVVPHSLINYNVYKIGQLN